MHNFNDKKTGRNKNVGWSIKQISHEKTLKENQSNFYKILEKRVTRKYRNKMTELNLAEAVLMQNGREKMKERENKRECEYTHTEMQIDR